MINGSAILNLFMKNLQIMKIGEEYISLTDFTQIVISNTVNYFKKMYKSAYYQYIKVAVIIFRNDNKQNVKNILIKFSS